MRGWVGIVGRSAILGGEGVYRGDLDECCCLARGRWGVLAYLDRKDEGSQRMGGVASGRRCRLLEGRFSEQTWT